MEKKTKITIAFAVDKGGTGKTTTVLNVAAGLARRGYKVLAIDCDQQANLTETLLRKPTIDSMRSSILDNTSLPIIQIRENINLVPAGADMFGIGIPLIMKSINNEAFDYRLRLKQLLTHLRGLYDFILIDCPPSDNVLMFNALYAADTVVIVTKPEQYCILGAKKYCDIIRAAREHNNNLGLAGILLTNYETGSRGHINAEKVIREAAPRHVFDSKIRHSRHLYNAAVAHQDIFEYAPNSIGAADYEAFIFELLNRL